MSALPQQPGSASQRPPIDVLVVDDQQAVREGVARLIACGSVPLRSVTTAASADEALACVRLSAPDVVVLDVDLDGADGLALIPHLSAATRVLVLTSHGDAQTRLRAQTLGALGFVEKHEPASALLASLAAVAFPQSQRDAAPTATGQESPPRAVASSDAPHKPRS